MRLSEILLKMGRGETLSAVELDELERKADTIDAVDSLVSGWIEPGTTIPFIRNLKAENVLIPSGEITLGEGTPGNNFSGLRIAFPALTYDGESWNLVGVNADVMQVGIRASDGKLVAGEGNVELSDGGISIIEGGSGQSWLSFYNTGIVESVAFKFASDSLQLQSLVVGGKLSQMLKMTNGDTPYVIMEEDAAQTNRTYLHLLEGTFGARFAVGSGAKFDVRSEGTGGGSTFIRLLETTATPPNPNSGDAFHLYMKGDKLIIQFNDGGTVRYKYLDLTGVGTTWTHTTVAP